MFRKNSEDDAASSSQGPQLHLLPPPGFFHQNYGSSQEVRIAMENEARAPTAPLLAAYAPQRDHASQEEEIIPIPGINIDVPETPPPEPECMSKTKNQLLITGALMGIGFFGGVIYGLGHAGRQHEMDTEIPFDEQTSLFLIKLLLNGFAGMAAMLFMSVVMWTNYKCNESGCCSRARPGR